MLPLGPSSPNEPIPPCSPPGPLLPGEPTPPCAPLRPIAPSLPRAPCGPTTPVGPGGPLGPCAPRSPSGPAGELLPCSTAISVPRPLSSFSAMVFRFFFRLSWASRIELSCSTSSALILPSPDSMESFVQPHSSVLRKLPACLTETVTNTSDATAHTAATAANAVATFLPPLCRGTGWSPPSQEPYAILLYKPAYNVASLLACRW
mmetsp:Transcript_78720/g.127653  ORF Transcript_78720/g.127653 Transcript_78720/m.127653 type:complete len:205 (+) Transcript_78720:1259-1873(+)